MKIKFLILIALFWSACNLMPTIPRSSEQQSAQPKESAETSPTQDKSLKSSAQCQNTYQPAVQGASWKYQTKTVAKAPLIDNAEKTVINTITEVHENGFVQTMEYGSGELVTKTDWQCKNGDLISLDVGGVGEAEINKKMGEGKVEIKVDSNSGITVPAELKPGQTWEQQTSVIAKPTNLPANIPANAPANLQDMLQKMLFRATANKSYRAIDFEEVEVPAGKFKALKIECEYRVRMNAEIEGKSLAPKQEQEQDFFVVQATRWLAPGVGLVKMLSDSKLGGKLSLGKSEWSLISYNIP